MKDLQRLESGPARERVPPDMRWAMFWLFWAYYALSGLEVVLALRRSSEGLALSVATFAAFSFLAGGLVTAAWNARFEGVGLLMWVERLPGGLVRSAQLAGLVLIVGALFSDTPWGAGMEALYESAFMLGFGLTALAVFCKVRPLIRRRRV